MDAPSKYSSSPVLQAEGLHSHAWLVSLSEAQDRTARPHSETRDDLDGAVMSSISLTLGGVLALVGDLNDSAGEDTSAIRFRAFLKEQANEVGQVRDYIQESLATTGEQEARAFQDLVNHVGTLLGFEVTFGRYKGVKGEIGFDGHWKSPDGFHLVVEAKKSEVFSINTAALLGYVDQLVAAGGIPSAADALGLYVVGQLNPAVSGLENAIIAQSNTHRLRVISADSLLSIAELKASENLTHADVLGLLRPSGPTIDPLIDLIAALAAQEEPGPFPPPKEKLEAKIPGGIPSYWMTPVKGNQKQSAEEVIQGLVGNKGIYAFGDRTPGRKHLKPGDMICFYATAKGVVGHARVTTSPSYQESSAIEDPEQYPWVFNLEDQALYLNDPRVLDPARRSQLDAFKGKDPAAPWAWFVQATRRISKHDFDLLVQ
jgi:hypothetical protein